jgi:hypothetical protein
MKVSNRMRSMNRADESRVLAIFLDNDEEEWFVYHLYVSQHDVDFEDSQE